MTRRAMALLLLPDAVIAANGAARQALEAGPVKRLQNWLRRGWSRRRIVAAWQTALIAAARDPQPYQDGLVPDTLEGRQNMLTLATVLVMRRCRTAQLQDQKLPQAIYHGVFQSLDDALREDGVGDSSIARKIRKMGEHFVGLARSLDDALETGEDHPVFDSLTRNGVISSQKAPALLAWMRALEARLEVLPDTALESDTPQALT